MIYLYWGGNAKKMKAIDAISLMEEMLRTNYVMESVQRNEDFEGKFYFDDEEGFNNRLKRGLDAHVWLEPYEPGYSDGDTLYWEETSAQCEANIQRWQDEI